MNACKLISKTVGAAITGTGIELAPAQLSIVPVAVTLPFADQKENPFADQKGNPTVCLRPDLMGCPSNCCPRRLLTLGSSNQKIFHRKLINAPVREMGHTQLLQDKRHQSSKSL